MKILADENMPYVEELFAQFGDIERVDGRALTPEQVSQADVLLVRSITKVTPALLAHNQRLIFVGSATIGTDHIDLQYLQQSNIPFSSAPGCNATAVGEYAFIAMLELARQLKQPLKDKVVGIVGAGNTGSAVAKCLTAYGMKVMLCDPFKQAQGDERDFYRLDDVINQADVVSLHVPLTREGEYPTWHLFDDKRLSALKPNAWLLNCCRGDVVDNQSLLAIKQHRDDLKLVLDVWEGEPNPMAELVALVDIATPHIAGYSLEGKARGTYMLYQKLCDIVKCPVTKSLEDLLPPFYVAQFKLNEQADLMAVAGQQRLLNLCRMAYDIRDDDERFRQQFAIAGGFDLMRKQHKHRREFSALQLNSTPMNRDGQLSHPNPHVGDNVKNLSALESLGFNLK
ncbi:4-phosphoerythronate dehydrogenase [Shewanella intestini]|uniref:Erythronate-4-phosphate dehydrogenase n=1 Tax=Shewanella intestini TaxID=2017544 RepID=A0ABS5HZQ8_9GAMM|nr:MULTISPECIES: 4-phosphoerythronate dehydrogenase [Shewanella]MBR9726914.1 DUF3410 domain-containing protein [Shewanella intestini]MRG34520.1 DUF3410 domain-containing protein [Shewanella sp. XMDDZSB0408]